MCVLIPLFSKTTNEVRITSNSKQPQSINIESFVRNGSIFTSSEPVQTLTINITSAAELSDIMYFFNTGMVVTIYSSRLAATSITVIEVKYISFNEGSVTIEKKNTV